MRSPLKLVVFVAVLVVLAGSQVHARIPIPAHWGDTVASVADIPQEVLALSENPGELSSWKLGWKYTSFGVFYSDVWAWSPELVIVKDHTYMDLPESVRGSLATKYPFSDADRGIWRKVGAKVLAVLVLFGLLVSLKEKISGTA